VLRAHSGDKSRRRYLFYRSYLDCMISAGYGCEDWPAVGEVWEEVSEEECVRRGELEPRCDPAETSMVLRPVDARDKKKPVRVVEEILHKFCTVVEEEPDE